MSANRLCSHCESQVGRWPPTSSIPSLFDSRPVHNHNVKTSIGQLHEFLVSPCALARHASREALRQHANTEVSATDGTGHCSCCVYVAARHDCRANCLPIIMWTSQE